MSALSGLRGRIHGTGDQLLGLFVIVPRVEVVEAAAAAGFDVVVLDCEHGPYGVDGLSPLVAAAHGAGIYAIVRVAGHNGQAIGAALDCGADGVLVPHVGSGEEAQHLVCASRFPPDGHRSIHPWVRAAQYGAQKGYVSSANDSVAVLAMVEGSQAHARLDDILQAGDLDGVFVGPMDLAASLGLADTPDDPRVREAAGDIVARAKRSGKATSIFAPTPQDARTWLAAGVRLVVLSVDTALMHQAFATAVRTTFDPMEKHV